MLLSVLNDAAVRVLGPVGAMVDADVLLALATRPSAAELVPLYAAACMRHSKSVEEWPVVADTVVDALLAWQTPTLALAVLERLNAAVRHDWPDLPPNEAEWILDISYTLELVVRLHRGDNVAPMLEARPVALNPARIAEAAREHGQAKVRVGPLQG